MSGYSGFLKDDREIYIPHWSVSVSLENLTKASQYLGADNLVAIASNKSVASSIVALTQATEAKQAVAIITYFVCQARVDGEKLTQSSVDQLFKGKLQDVMEIFATVVHAQYAAFFEHGLVKEPSPND